MARIRTIKPEFWTSDQVTECSRNSRLLFIGMWNFCDDAGRHVASPKRVKGEVFPCDDLTIEDISGMINELLAAGLIEARLSPQGFIYWQVTGWHHQIINKPQKPKIQEGDVITTGTVPEQSRNTTAGRERKGKDRKGKDEEGKGREGISSFTEESVNEPAKPDKPPVFTFPCSGEPKTWDLTPSHLQRLIELYPTLDVQAECRKALAWCEAGNAKTARGMPRFLTNWLNRATDRKPTAHQSNGRETRGDRNKRLAEQWILDDDRTEGTT